MNETEAPEVTPERRQKAAVAVLSTPVLQRMGLRPGRETRRRLKDAEAIAMIEGYDGDITGWARSAYRSSRRKR